MSCSKHKFLGSAEPDETYAHDLVAALDFGTTYSGYAYSFPCEPLTIHLNDQWNGPSGRTNKTPSCVLVDGNFSFISFGYDAQRDYFKMKKNGENVHFFTNFKMDLYLQETWNSNLEIQAEDGIRVFAITIFSEVLRGLKEHLLETLRKKGYSSICNIQWVLTVPAIWSEGAKKLMRKAAHRAGLIDSENSNNLLIALEPEVASLYCRSLPSQDFTVNTMGSSLQSLREGTKYMVADCGGGTVDITIHELQPGGKIKELYAPSGGPWGSTLVDKNFHDIINKTLGESFIRRFKKKEPHHWMKLGHDFEIMKRSLRANDDDIMFTLAPKIVSSYKRESQSTLRKPFVSLDGIEYEDGDITIDMDTVRTVLFKNAVDSIVLHIKKILEQLERLPGKKLSHIFVVGGFADCQFLQEQLKLNFESNHKICIPMNAEIAVLKGAVIFGQDTSVIKSRIVPKTYGIQTLKPFDSAVHDSRKLLETRSGTYCQDIFLKLVEVGEEVFDGKTYEKFLSPESDHQENLTLHVFCSKSSDIEYVTDSRVTRVGQIKIPLPNYGDARNIDVKVQVEFGGTEMTVKATQLGCLSSSNTDELTVSFTSGA